ncbi:hypothetical protein [Peterkaempfera bronchialis]|uniref:hypothetical protein n=1 Tax=Peterkaempfera bronchialis TaxID=2126346 RepID=UPI003C2B4366
MSTAPARPRSERLHAEKAAAGDAVPAPARLLTGPGRSWTAEARWTRAQIRVGGRWRPARIERWRLRQGSLRWSARITWQTDDGRAVTGWYLCERTGVRPLGGW